MTSIFITFPNLSLENNTIIVGNFCSRKTGIQPTLPANSANQEINGDSEISNLKVGKSNLRELSGLTYTPKIIS